MEKSPPPQGITELQPTPDSITFGLNGVRAEVYFVFLAVEGERGAIFDMLTTPISVSFPATFPHRVG